MAQLFLCKSPFYSFKFWDKKLFFFANCSILFVSFCWKFGNGDDLLKESIGDHITGWDVTNLSVDTPKERVLSPGSKSTFGFPPSDYITQRRRSWWLTTEVVVTDDGSRNWNEITTKLNWTFPPSPVILFSNANKNWQTSRIRMIRIF